MQKNKKGKAAPLPPIGGPFKVSENVRDVMHKILDHILQTCQPKEISQVKDLLAKLTNPFPTNPPAVRAKRFRGNYP